MPSNGKTEVILAPKVDRQDLKEVKNRMNDAFEDVSRKSEKELERGTSRGVKDGIEKGGGDGLNFLKRGLVGLAAAVGAAAIGALSGLDEDISRKLSRIENIRDISKEAGAFGVSSGEFAQASAIFQSLGYDQSDLRDLLAGFRAELQNPEMANFRKISQEQGVLQSMLSYIATAGSMTGEKRANLLQPLGNDDAVIAGAIADLISRSGAGNLQALFETATGKTITAEELAKAIAANQADVTRLGRYTSGTYIEDIQRGASAEEIIQKMQQDRRLEMASESMVAQKLVVNEIKVEAQIAAINATSSTINGIESIIREMEGIARGERSERTQELTRKIESGDFTSSEFVEDVVRQTMLSFSGIFENIFGSNTVDDKNQQDYTQR